MNNNPSDKLRAELSPFVWEYVEALNLTLKDKAVLTELFVTEILDGHNHLGHKHSERLRAEINSLYREL